MKPGSARALDRAGHAQLRAWWQALPRRQRMLAAIAGALLAGAALWWLAIGPALATLRTAPAQRQALDLQLQGMRQLEAQALAMRSTQQSLPPLGRDEAQRALEATVKQHFSEAARLAFTGEGATLTLSGVSGEALARWLVQARLEARTLPLEARLNRQASGLWEGRLALALPPVNPTR